jgi:3-oxoacyl-[acyl-carrier protein] reductase
MQPQPEQSFNRASPLAGKVAIVTGASRGIGRAIAVRLARDGAAVVLTARDAGLLEATATEIRKAGGRAEAFPFDLRLPAAPAELVASALRAFGGLDVLINNAGATKRGDFLALSDADWMDGFALKFFGAVRLTRAAWPHLKARQGCVLNIAGVGGRTPGADSTIGGSVNAAVLTFTKAMADAGVRDGVQVNAINPGFVRTDRLQARLESAAKEQGVDVGEAARRLVMASKVTRLGEPEDVAALTAFIVSPEGRFLQGSLIDLDGGQTKTL